MLSEKIQKLTASASRFSFSLIPLLGIIWALGIFETLGLNLYVEQILASAVALALIAIFLEGAKSASANAWKKGLDVTFGLLGSVSAFYLAINYPTLLNELYARPLDLLICSTIIVITTLEATRRIAGLPLAFVVFFFLLFGLIGHLIPGDLQGRKTEIDRLITYLAADSNSMLGMPLSVTVSIVIAFILFGSVLESTGGGKYFTNVSLALLGRFTGGAAKIAITASALFGSISGSAVANVASTGVITIPLMKKSGYSPTQSAAIEGVASTGGQLAPPVMGAAAFLMAETLQIPYQKVIIAALIPACLYFISLFLQADLLARRDGIKPIPKEEIPPLKATFFGGLHYLAGFILLIIALFAFNYPPGESALIAAGFLFAVQFIPKIGKKEYRLQSPKRLLELFSSTGETCAAIIVICASAGFIIGVLNISTLGFALSLSLLELTGDSLVPLLIMAAVLSIILGMGMPTVGVYVLLGTLIAPAIVEAGTTEIGAHLFVLYFGMMSMITPPVAIAAFSAAAIAGTRPMITASQTVLIAWTAYVIPFLFIASPELLFQGSPLAIMGTVLLSLLGIGMISSGSIGYLFGKLSMTARILVLLLGIGCLASMNHPFLNISISSAAILFLSFLFITSKKKSPLHTQA